MNKNLLYILVIGLLFGFGFSENSIASETTGAPSAQPVSPAVFNDGSCSTGTRYDHLCCYKNIRYSCSFLNDQFRANLCRPNARNLRASSWRTCDNGIPSRLSPQAPAQVTPRPQTSTSLDYAADLTACGSYGVRNAGGSGYCARGVRHALACMARRRGRNVNNMYFHCGGSAYDYFGGNCLERRGFVNDMNACNTPGVVRVYYGYRHQNRSYSGGDRHGHIEFLGTNGLWYAGASSATSIDVRLGASRRILKACYVLPPGRI